MRRFPNVFAVVMVNLMFAGTSFGQAPAAKATAPDTVSRLQVRLAEIEKRLGAVEAQLARIVATAPGAARAQPGQLSGTYQGSGSWQGAKVTFLGGRLLQIVSAANGGTSSGTYTIEDGKVVGDFGVFKVIYQIVDSETLTELNENHPYNLKKQH